MSVNVELFDDLAAIARDAGGALDRAATPSLFDRLDWFRLTLAHCPPPGTPLVARAASGEDRAWLFLMRDGAKARTLGSWYTLDYRPIVRGGEAEPLLAGIAGKLRRQGIATIETVPMIAPQTLSRAFAQAGWISRETPMSVNWRVRTGDADFAAYWASRPGQLRATVRRKGPGARLAINIHSHFDPDIWAAYEHVYAQSWKPAEGSPAFLRALAEAEGAAGTLRLGIATRDGAPVAAQFWLVEHGVATIHKLAHLASADAFSPGTLLSAAMFEHVIDRDRPEWIDFGTGDDAYKADWMDEQRPLYRFEADNPATPHGLANTARSLVRRLRRG